MPLDQLTQRMPQAGKKLNSKLSVKGKKDEIIINPKDDNEREYVKEEKDSTAVMAFGRFNPPTVGHEKLIHTVHQTAKQHGGSAHVFASHSEGTSNNPLPQKHKLNYLKKVAEPHGVAIHGSSKEEPNFLNAAKKLHDAGHKHLVMVAGSDRVKDYEERLKHYNGKEGHYNFKSIKVVSSGERDPDAEGVSGMSGTKMRAHARAGEHEQFKAGLPKALYPHAKEIMNHIKSIKEDVNEPFEAFAEQLTFDKQKVDLERSKRLSYLKKMNSSIHNTHKGIHDKIHESRGHKVLATALGNIERWKKVSFADTPPKEKPEEKKQESKKLKEDLNLSFRNFCKMVDVVESTQLTEQGLQSLKEKAEETGIPYEILKEVYDRGVADWQQVDYTTQTPQQWAFARVNSFITQGRAYDLDYDLHEALKDACWKGYKAIGMKKKNGKQVPNCVPEETELDEGKTPAWQRKAGKNPEGGLNRAGIASYRRENPGSKLSLAVTTKPSKLKKGSKAAKRRKSFCARMSGMKKRLTSAKTARDPD